jgi:exopolysaccharide biosynthesis polyprenyl glycosylphosphotransferase
VSGLVRELTRRRELGYNVMRQLDKFDESAKHVIETLRPDEVILLNPRATETETMDAIDLCNDLHITFKYSADLFDTYATRMAVYPLAGVPIIELKRTPLDGWGRVVKRGFDVLISCFILLASSPALILVSLIILIETGRPIIYKNERVGLRGRHFFTYKFRSMYQKDSTGVQFGDSGQAALAREEELIKLHNTRTGPIYKIGNDPRVTPFGHWLRRWSIDELPQFWNVLKGDMSIVGPRPHQPREVIQYTKIHRAVFTLKPGITGLAQISGRSDLPYSEEANLDVFYIEHWSLSLDIIIFLKTPFVVFKKRLVP